MSIRSHNDWSWQIDREFPTDISVGRQLMDELIEELQRRGWTPRDVFGVHMAVEEALVNAVKHGNRLDPSKTIRFVCRLSDEAVHIEIADQGPGFNPETVPDPTDDEHIECTSGRGVMLIKSFMTYVEYNHCGNHVRMRKVRAG